MNVLKTKIAIAIRAAILSGEYPPERSLPPVRELCRIFGASTVTVQKALFSLKSEGLIYGVNGKGVFVSRTSSLADSKKLAFIHPPHSKALGTPPYLAETVKSFSSIVAKSGYSVACFSAASKGGAEIAADLKKMDFAGICLFETYNDNVISEIRALNLPTLSLDYDTHRSGLPSVVHDNLWAGFEAAVRLHASGHRHILIFDFSMPRFIGDRRVLDSSEEERLTGFRMASRHLGLVETCIKSEYRDPEIGGKISAAVLAQPSPTAIYLHNDMYFSEVELHMRKIGFLIPRDIAIVSTGVRSGTKELVDKIVLDFSKMGEIGARILISMINGVAPVASRHVIQPIFLGNNTEACGKHKGSESAA